MTVGALALLGWVFDIAVFKSVVPGLPPIKANVTVSLILIGIALWIASAQAPSAFYKIIAQVCAGSALLIALATLVENLLQADFGIDLLLVPDVVNYPSDIPGRMSTRVGLCLVMLATALLLMLQNSRVHARAIQTLALVSVLVAFTGLIGYAYGIESLHLVQLPFAPMSLHAAATIVLLGFALASARPEFLFRHLLTSRSTAARHLLPAAIVLPFAIGWLVVLGYRSDYFSAPVGIALFAVANMAGLSAVTLWNAYTLAKLDELRKQSEATLRESEDQFKYVFDHSPIGKSITSPTGEMHVNQAFCEMLGYAEEEIRHKTWQDFTHPDDIALSQNALAPLLTGESESVNFTKRYLHKNGSVVWVDIGTSLRRDEAGQPIYFMTSMHDITERKRDEAEIRTLNAELEQRVLERTTRLAAANSDLESFAYSVSHDLRTPLRAIDGFSLQVLKRYADKLDEEGVRYLNIVRDNTKKMSQLIDDILAFSRMGRVELSTVAIQMDELARAALEELKPMFEGRELRVEIKPLPPCHGDPALLRQVWLNLLGNAIKFTRHTPAAWLEAGGQVEGTEAVYYVKDNGVGFDMQYVDKLYGVFQRLHGNEEFEGTGIGLAIVKRIVTRHGGRVWAQGQVNQGATFYFALPVN